MTLQEFLAARLAEDEAAVTQSNSAPDDALRYLDADRWSEPFTWRFNEDRMLREVEAKRKILTRYEFASCQAAVNVGTEQQSWEKIAGALERDVMDLAAVWSDHPDYDEAWRP